MNARTFPLPILIAISGMAGLPQATLGQSKADQPLIQSNSLGMRLVKLPAGEFSMGSEENPADLERAV